MNKRITCLVLTAALMLGVFLLIAPTAHAAEEEPVRYSLSQAAIEILKEDEGFEEEPYWDFHHYSIGYGTLCPDDKVSYYKKHPITREEGEKMLKEHAATFEKAVYRFADRYGMTLTQYQLDALVLFSYNVGSAWMSDTDGIFHQAIAQGATGNELINAFVLWSKTDGKYTPGKLRRRRCDANMYLNGVYSRTAPDNYCHTLFDLNGGESEDYLVQGYDSNITTQINPVATREGYIFKGWYTAPTDGEKVTILDSDTKDITLYAQWIADDGTQIPAEKPKGVKVTVTAEGAQHQKGPGAAYETAVGTAPYGEKIVIEETSVIGEKTWGRYGDNWIDLSYTDYEAVMEEIRNRVLFTGTIKVSSKLNVRSGPGTKFEVVDSYKNGAKIEVKEEKHVGTTKWGRTDKGWISLDYVKDIVIVWVEPEEPEEPETPVTPPINPDAPTEPEPTEPEPTEPEPTEPEPTEPEPTEPTEPPAAVVNTYKVTASSLNIRKSAGVDGAKVGSYKKDTVVTVLETKKVGSTTWAKTDKGWVSMEYLTLVETGGNNTQQPDIQQPDTQQPAANTYQVTASSLNIRKSASSSANKIGSYKKSTVVTVLETKKVGSTTWAKTDKGWVSMEYLTPVKTGSSDTQQPDNLQTQGKTYTVTASRLNVRKSASSSAKVVDCYEKGTKVTVLETKKVGSVTWGRTSKGWISMQYVK